ncbi:ABC transporter ATP-binding protein/permease [Pseudomonas chlororaphis]|uniref:ABC transporter ATP-binding protein/permease n=1 Tax=Pseudomonas chlororaphis TaxID=587753 RepID=UPI001E5AA6D2|nr:ABC transporter ATP-binding protein/permease [Pseudomonas chlororaphis]MCB2253816.1 ABC transporter ATP-binding protein/permease [Pseudomonas chlororaphis]
MKPLSNWALIRPFWVSEKKWPAYGLLALIIAVDLSVVYSAVQISNWQKNFFDALAAYDLEAIRPLLLTLLALVSLYVVVKTSSTYLRQLLTIRWRSWLTEVFLQRWLQDHAYHRLEKSAKTDNPDQRIAEDLNHMATNTLELALGLLSNLVNVVSYSVIIWGLSGTLSFALFGHQLELPGYMLWAGIAYALAGSLLMEKVGRPMIGLDYRQQQYEADFRYLLVRVRENAEQIALYRGENAEHRRLTHAFGAIRQNWRGLMTYTKRVAFTEAVYVEVGSFLPYFIVVPRYFAKQITIGGVMQLSIGFSRLRTALSWFLFNYKELALLRSVLQRLREFELALRQEHPGAIHISQAARLSTRNLHLELPDGRPLGPIPDIRIEPGERWLIRGPSGAGKSTLLRALARLWPHGKGDIELPPGRLLFLPQKSYLPHGTLKTTLCYPGEPEDFTLEQCRQALESVRLGQYSADLEHIDYWDKRLSPGEQQRLAFARVVLQRPDHLFLDEATSSLDPENEANLYTLLCSQLPDTTVVSIAHHQGLERWHTHRLNVGQAAPRRYKQESRQ